MELLGTFDHVAMALQGGVPRSLGTLRVLPRRWNVKVWLDAEACPKLHYEAQILTPRHVPGAKVVGLELGFHAEDRDEAVNAEALARLVDAEAQWREVLGPDAVAGPFLGRATRWRRVSETWPDPDLSDPDVVVEIADRLAAYVTCLAPLLRD